MTFVAALRHDRIEAPWLIDGPIDGEGFRTYVEKALAPTLKPGDLVIMDNLGSHKGEAVRQAIRSAGAKLFFLPKYSPDLNPIEQVFAKLKHLLRKAAARTLETVVAAVGELLGAYTTKECANWDRQLEGAIRARATPVRVFLFLERHGTLGDVAPNREGALARRATMLCGRVLWIGNVKEIRDLIVNR
jgi:transposase